MDQQVEYEPESRLLHVAACSESSDGKVIVWGGQTSASYYSSDGRTKLVSIVQEFDPRTEVWCQRDTVGTPHPGLSVAACTSVGNDLFLYGGEVPGYVCGALSRLDVKTLTWSLLSPEAVPGGPMRKTDCGIVLFHRDKLAVIGGYGYPTGHSTQLGSKFIRKGGTDEVLGWTNEFHVFNISQGLWSSPMLKGTELPPCIAFTLTSINKHRAILFGGFQPGRRGRVNDLYIIDFDTMEITKLEPLDGELWPEERDTHAACCLGYGGDYPYLVVTGGTGKDGKLLTDILWLFGLSSRKWKKVMLPDGILPRWGHSATVVTLCEGLEEVILFGGSTDKCETGNYFIDYTRIAETIITLGQLGSESEWVLVGVTNNSQRGSSERVREKIDLKHGIGIKGPSFDSEKRITAYALYRIERGGIQLRKEISNKNRDFQAVLRLKQPDANLTMIKWINTERKTDITPTWKNLFLILRLIDLDHLAKQIEAYLRGTTVEQLPVNISSIEQVPGGKKFDLNSVFTMASLTQLERVVGIPVLTQLEANNHAFQSLIRVKKDDVSGAINKWLTAPVLSRLIPSWKNFLIVLCLIQLDDLAEQIKDYILKYPLLILKQECGEMEGDSREIFVLRQVLSDREETNHQLRKENEANEDTIKMLKERNQQLTYQLLSAGVVKKEQKDVKPSFFHSFEEVLSTMPSPTKSQQSLGPYYSEKESLMKSLIKKEELMMSQQLPVQVKKEPTEATTEYLSSAGGADVRATLLPSTEEDLESGLVQPFTVTPTTETVEIKPSLFHPTGLPGVEVCAETTVLVTNNPQSFIWKGYGLKLHIPQGCLPQDIPQCQIAIKASLAGQYEFPENSHLVSAVFWFHCEHRCVFTKPISLEMNHCAKSENVSKLRFVKATSGQNSLPYRFEGVGGNFNSYSSYGILKLERFCGIATVQDGSEEREYCALLFYLDRSIIRHRIDFVVVWNSETHLTVVRKEYSEAIAGPDQLVEFESNEIKLDIPITLVGGWKITPQITPVVLKKHVDRYQPGRRIPRCQLSAMFVESDKRRIPVLQYQVKLIGAKVPYNVVVIEPPIPSEIYERKRRRQRTSGDSSSSPESASDHAGPSPKKRKHTGSEMQLTHKDTQSEVKPQKVVKSGQITDADRLFNDIAQDIYNMPLEIGTELGLEDKYLRNELETGKFETLTGRQKAAKMLQFWRKSVSKDDCTYSVLAAALIKHGFQRCAYEYCYT